jgi:integrase
MEGPTINTFLDQRRRKKNDTYPVKLTIYYNGIKKRYNTGINVTTEQWNKLIARSTKDEAVKKLKEKLDFTLNKAKSIIDDVSEFTFESFERFFKSKRSDLNNVLYAHTEYANQLKSENRFGSAYSYEASLFTLKKFINQRNFLSFDEVTEDFLRRYEKWMLSEGKSSTTVGIYVRNLRVLYNMAISYRIIKVVKYPFGKNKYQIPNGMNIKKALNKEEISKIFKYESIGSLNRTLSKDLWMFSYLCSGINLCDILRLRYNNLEEKRIIFLRKKTSSRNHSRPLKPVIVNRNELIDAIIEKWGNRPETPESYVFPVLNKATNESHEYLLIKQFTKVMNNQLSNIAKATSIDKKITTYSARHSYATIMKRAGAPLEFISESLGHSNTKVTENYLDGFDDETREKYSKELTDFL